MGPTRAALAIRLLAGATAVVGLAIGVALRARFGDATVFFLILVVCGGFTVFARGLGSRLGAILGTAVGVLLTLALARHVDAPLSNVLAFAIIAGFVVALLGYFAGSRDEALAADGPDQSHKPVRDAADTTRLAPEQALVALLVDFHEWAEDHERLASGSHDADDCWPSFDQFLRHALRERIGARGVRVFRVVNDGQQIESLALGATAQRWPARNGLIGQVTTTGHMHVTDERSQTTPIEPQPPAGQSDSPEATPWQWLLPIRHAERVCALVCAARVEPRRFRGASMAGAVRDALQVFWAHVRMSEAARGGRWMDRQSGLLNRTELFNRLREASSSATRDGEPLMILALGLEGLRGLDDAARWSARDAAVQRVGRALREKVRSDDLLGRLSDDVFIVVLRRLDAGLGALVARNLMATARKQVGDLNRNSARLRIRGGLAGSGLAAVDGEGLLERALAQLERARRCGEELLSDAGAAAEPRLVEGRA